MPSSFPALPNDIGRQDIRRAYRTIKDTYRAAREVSQREESDPIRLKIWADSLERHLGLVDTMNEEGVLPAEWIGEAQEKLTELSATLR